MQSNKSDTKIYDLVRVVLPLLLPTLPPTNASPPGERTFVTGAEELSDGASQLTRTKANRSKKKKKETNKKEKCEKHVEGINAHII